MTFQTKLGIVLVGGLVIIVLGSIAGCGGVELAGLDSGATGVGGAAGTKADAGTTLDMSGTAGAGGVGGAAGTSAGTSGTAGAPACTAPLPTVEACRASGTPLVIAEFWCSETYDDSKSLFADNCTNSTMVGYYAGLTCPFSVVIATTPGWTGPAPEHAGAIVANAGTSMSAVWQDTADTVYCCSGNTVKKLDRCSSRALPLAAGCTSDGDCGSGICDSASRTCCNGRSDTCNVCTGGHRTPVVDGAVACGVCQGGTLIPLQDGTACGTSACGGEPQPTGQGPLPPAGTSCVGGGGKSGNADCYYPTATNSTCHVGVCVAANTNCSAISCPVGCTKKYSACYLSSGVAGCYCVDANYQICH